MKPHRIQVLFFAQLRALTRVPSLELPCTSPISSEELWKHLLRLHPTLTAVRSTTRLACNHAFLPPDALIHPGDEVACIPPVSGG